MSAVTPNEVGAWRAVSATRRGSAHAGGVPNQDAVRVERVAGTPDLWVVGVADGHGGARYVRSDVGARWAVDLAVESVSEALGGGEDPAVVLRRQVPRVVAAWREAVAAHARGHPFTADELARGAVAGTTAYGATLLVAVVGEHGVAVAQVGDGDALVRTHGFATRPVPGDDRLVAGETTSLCLDTAVDDFRYAVVPASAEPDLVMIATDGYGNSFAQTDWWHGLVDDVAAFVERSGFELVADELPGWLEDSARVGGDDVSAVLLVRDPLVDHAVARGPRTRELVGATNGVPSGVGERRTSRAGRRGAVAALAAAAAALGVVMVMFLLGPGRSEPRTPTEPSAPATSTTPIEPPTRTGTDGGREPGRDGSPRNQDDDGPGGPKKRAPGEESDDDKAPRNGPERPAAAQE